jgi:hypothetical protein
MSSLIFVLSATLRLWFNSLLMSSLEKLLLARHWRAMALWSEVQLVFLAGDEDEQ